MHSGSFHFSVEPLFKNVHNNTPLNVAWISVKQWYQLLLEQDVTHTTEDEDSPPVVIRSKFEENHPEVDAVHSYRLSRVFGLEPDQRSFLFKMLQSLLPTRSASIGLVKFSLHHAYFVKIQLIL